MHLFLHVSTSVTFKVLSICCNTLNIVAIFLNSPILMPFSAFAIFLFYLFHIGNTFPFEDFFSFWGSKRKICSGPDRVNAEGGAWRSCCFLVKNCWTLSTVWAGVLVNHPSWNGQSHWKILQKKFTELNTASHNNASWCTDVDGLLEHLLSGGSL